MEPCIWTAMLKEFPPEDAIRIIGEAGFRVVEFSQRHEKDYLEGKEDEGERIQSIRKAAEKANVSILQMHGHLFNPCGKDAAEHIAWAHRSLERAAALGAKWVVLHPGTVGDMGADPEIWEETKRRNVEIFRSWAATAGRVGVGIAIENLMSNKGYHFGATVRDLLWLCDQLPADHVGVCWDTGHARVSCIDQVQALRVIGSRLKAVHIHDNDGLSDKHWTPGQGDINWPALVNVLREIGFTGPFNLEVAGEWLITPVAARAAKTRYLAELCRIMLDPAFAQEHTVSQAG